MNDTFERLRALIATEFGLDPATVSPETELTVLEADSLAALEFRFLLEKEIRVRLDATTDLRNGKIGTLVAILDKVRAGRQIPAVA